MFASLLYLPLVGPENYNQKKTKAKQKKKRKELRLERAKQLRKLLTKNNIRQNKLTFQLETQNLSKIPSEELAALLVKFG